MSKMLKLSSLSVAAIVLGMSVNELKAAPIVIDNFTASTASYPLFDMVQDTNSVNSGVDAGIRVVTLTTTAKTSTFADFTAASVAPDLNGIFDYNSTSGAAGIAKIEYGSANANLAPTTIVIPDDYSFFFEFLEYDLANGAPLAVSLTLFNGAASATQNTTLTVSGPQSVTFDANLFAASVRSNVTGLAVTFTAAKGTDYRLGSIIADTSTIIPEPAALAFTAPGALALLARRRRA